MAVEPGRSGGGPTVPRYEEPLRAQYPTERRGTGWRYAVAALGIVLGFLAWGAVAITLGRSSPLAWLNSFVTQGILLTIALGFALLFTLGSDREDWTHEGGFLDWGGEQLRARPLVGVAFTTLVILGIVGLIFGFVWTVGVLVVGIYNQDLGWGPAPVALGLGAALFLAAALLRVWAGLALRSE